MTDEELKRLLEASAEGTRRHFDVAIEHVDARFDGLAETVQLLDQKLTREVGDLRSEMRHGFAETQAMIRFSHSELELGMRSLEEGDRNLEETVAGLQARIERLER